jgi:DedD protein
VLVVAGVLGFPWLFETQPRPMSQDVQIVQATQAPGAGVAGASSQADRLPARSLSGRVGVAAITPPTVSPTEVAQAEVDGGSPGREAAVIDETASAIPDGAAAKQDKPVAKPAAAKPADKKPAQVKPEPKPEAKPEPKAPEHKAADKPAEKPADKKPADKKPADKKEADKPQDKATKAPVRYVVQFGAFADVASAQAARAKVEKLGIKTYAQQVDTPAGKRTRVRVGPFADKAEAEKANATVRKAGLTGSILTL